MVVSRKKLYILGGVFVAIVAIGFGLYMFSGKVIDIKNEGQANITKAGAKSQLSGIICNTYQTRPFAVMVSSDIEARPLSGINEADMVFEMPVVENGFTRMMAVFQCGRPKEVGSVRSSRLDFVPLALGLNAIYAHFGGEKTVLEELNSGIIDNIDGLKYDGTIYYRKSNIPRPHNAFTNFDLLTQVSKDLNYNMIDGKVSYPHEDKSTSLGNANPQPVFTQDFQVTWRYDKNSNSYFRTRSGKAEIDKNTGKQTEAKNIVIMKTTWSSINKDYIRVKTVGSGGLLVYKDGIVVTGNWEKKDDKSKLYLYDQNHKEILLAAGSTWVEITTAQ